MFSILVEQLCQQLLFDPSGLRETARKANSNRCPSVSPLFQNPFGKHSSCLDECRIVQQRERGQRRIGTGPLSRALLAAGRVQCLEHRVQELPLPVHVDYRVAIGVDRCLPRYFALGEIQVTIVSGGLVRIDTRSTIVLDQ